MSTVPTRRHRTIRTAATIALGATAAVLALGSGMLTLGSSLSTAVASAELAAGAALISRTTWMLPALFTVMVFVGMVVAVHLIGGRRGPQTTEARTRTRDAETTAAIPFELRAPDRAVAEATRGLFRHIDS
ncbi:hypothetical protein [Dietzia sp. B32]|uniref:hypothetical protein n=1 Tax=Dietzia sp. B32 TaxID=2915130 RepID=UPI0021ADEC77|nr:hypothetical protein [Dietzia sp. B32]UVE96364.1 hypothetical protein L8M95_06230 [Dietzia sp. B32]